MASPNGGTHGALASTPTPRLTAGVAPRLQRRVATRLRTLASASVATASATAFLILATSLSFVPEARQAGAEAWRLRGALEEPASPAALTHARVEALVRGRAPS